MKEEVLYYDKTQVSHYAKNDYTKIFAFLNEEGSYDLFQQYERHGLNKHNAVYDRSGMIPHYLNIAKGLHPMPNHIDGYNKSFYEIAEKRCKELLATNKVLEVMWSGGIDSTFILLTCTMHTSISL